MNKYFVFADVHGFYDEFIAALKEAGYDENNPDHILLGCGDYFDRGEKPKEVMDFLMSHKSILIRGNHEDLMEEMLERGYPKDHDFMNRTVDTAKKLGRYPYKVGEAIEEFYSKMINYYETKNYIFVHGWIPVTVGDNMPSYYVKYRKFEYNENWRNASAGEWNQARWINGIDACGNKGIREPNKTIICGHWHCSWGHALAENNKELEETKFDPFYADGIIAIDACTAFSHKVNVIVIEDEEIETN